MPKTTKNNPTPNLSIPKSDRQHFTYSENKLLDQITMEVMEAWKKDLTIIRKHHLEILESEKSVIRLSDMICKEFPKLEEFLNSNNFIFDFRTFRSKIESLDLRTAEIHKVVFELDKKSSFDYIIKTQIQIKDLSDKLTKITELLNINQNKKWWHRFFKPKT